MTLKIFSKGFSEQQYNEFCDSHVIVTTQWNADGAGACYVIYKELTALGLSRIEQVEQIDRAISKAQQDILEHELTLDESRMKLNDVKEKISKTNPNEKKEWDGLQGARISFEDQIKMSEKTISGRKENLINLKDRVQTILNER